MMEFSGDEIAVALSIPLLVGTTHFAYEVRRRLMLYFKTQCVERIATMIVAKEEPSDGEICSLRRRFTSGVILDAVTFISEHIYGKALNRLLLIVEVCDIPYSSVRHERFGETVTLIEAYPDHAVRYIARLDTALTWHDTALLAQIMRRTGSPIAYTPLLASQNRNLQLIGIYLCEHFSIVDAEPHLQRLVAEEDREIAYIALLALCSIRGDIATPQVGKALAQLLPYQRAAFLRHAVLACYSLRSCSHLLAHNERRLLSQRINSYKCQIVCN